MPNQWAQSQLECFNEDQLTMSTGTQSLIYQCQTNGHDLVSYRYKSEARNYQCQTNGHDLFSLYVSTRTSYQCQQEHKLLSINAKPMGTILNLFVKTRNDYSLAVNSMEYLYQLMYLSLYFTS